MPKEKSKGKNNRFKILIGLLVCVLILVYLGYELVVYFSGNSVQLYEVSEGYTESKYESQYSALAIREETVVYSPSSGYVNFFVGDSTPLAVGEETYLIDESGTLYEELSESASEVAIFNESELLKIKNTIYDFDTTFDADNFYDVYNFKYKLESQLIDIIYSSAFESSSLDLSNYTVLTSDISGIMVHSIDGFEDADPDEMEASYFRQSNYERTIITSNDYIEQGDAVYKVVTSEEWELVIQIEDSSVFEDVDSLDIEFLKDGITATCDFYMYTTAGNTYGVLSLDKYMYRYVSDRYLQIAITDDTLEGLKIPKSALTQEQFYTIPVEFLTTGGNSSSSGFLVQTESEEEGETAVQFVVPDIVKTTDEYVYVSSEFLSEGDILVQTDTNETYTVRARENIDGVYVSENGTYTFSPVNIIGENGDYYIVEDESGSSALSLYDNVVENAESISEE